ncbi:hypothetical protein ACSBR2_026065 [Camellia fascicularis]
MAMSFKISTTKLKAIDLGATRADLQAELDQACKDWGAFHVTNHGVPIQLLNEMRRVGVLFFEECPMAEKIKYSCDSTSFASECYGSRMLVSSNDIGRMSEAELGAHTIKSHGASVARNHRHDWLILLLLVVTEIILYMINPFYRFVGEEMMVDLKLPLKPNTVPVWIVPDDVVIQFINPKVQASIAANTWVVSGSPQTKKLQDILPGILNQLGPDNLDNLRKLAEQFQKQAPGAGAGAGATAVQEDDDD